MIQRESRLRVADNSGAREVLCINMTGASNRRYAGLGDIITCSVKDAQPGGAVGMHEVVKAVIVRTTKEYRRFDGSYIKFRRQCLRYRSRRRQPTRHTHIRAQLHASLREREFNRIVSLAPEVL